MLPAVNSTESVEIDSDNDEPWGFKRDINTLMTGPGQLIRDARHEMVRHQSSTKSRSFNSAERFYASNQPVPRTAPSQTPPLPDYATCG